MALSFAVAVLRFYVIEIKLSQSAKKINSVAGVLRYGYVLSLAKLRAY